jgi:hypothetical protein
VPPINIKRPSSPTTKSVSVTSNSKLSSDSISSSTNKSVSKLVATTASTVKSYNSSVNTTSTNKIKTKPPPSSKSSSPYVSLPHRNLVLKYTTGNEKNNDSGSGYLESCDFFEYYTYMILNPMLKTMLNLKMKEEELQQQTKQTTTIVDLDVFPFQPDVSLIDSDSANSTKK